MSFYLKITAFLFCPLAFLLLLPSAGSLPFSISQATALQTIPSPTPPRPVSTSAPPTDATARLPDGVATKASLLTAVAAHPTVLTPTPYIPPPRIALTSAQGGSYKTLREKPPFTLELSGYIDASLDTRKEECGSAYWDWGDGTRDITPCISKVGALYTGRHTYTRYGSYNARLSMTLVGAGQANSDSQIVVIGSDFPDATPLHDAARWVLWAGTLGLALALLRGFRRTGLARLGFWLALLALFTYLPPFSYFPNPLGIYWSRLGGYSYDLRLPFWNGFAVASLPTNELQRTLDGLIGQTGGLDPFNPVQPLTGYRFLSVYLQKNPATYGNYAHVVIELTYADGTRREVTIPLREARSVLGAYRIYGNPSMGRLFTQHEEFPMTVFPWQGAPVALGTPQPLMLHPDTQRWDRYNPGDWVLGPENRRLVFAPDGKSFLVASAQGSDKNDLWLIKLDGSPSTRIAQNVINYDWSPNGFYIVYNQASSNFPVFVRSLNSGIQYEVARPGVQQLPGMTREGVWYLHGKQLVVASFDRRQQRQVATVEGANNLTIALPSPDGGRVAYIHEGGLYLRDAGDQGLGAPIARVQNAAWSPNGNKLAWVNESDSLGVVQRSGKVLFQVPVGPIYTNLFYSMPQWSPDERFIFLQTFPFSGRRIVWVDATTSAALDLTQPRWDPLFALAPGGKYLLMTNGRGGFWRSDITYTNP